MELKELYKNILSSFDVEDVQEFSAVLYEHLLNGKTAAFEKYLPCK